MSCRKRPDLQLICFHLIKILCYRQRQQKWKLLFAHNWFWQIGDKKLSPDKKRRKGRQLFWTIF
jgi:hypothetical protein